MRNPRDQWGAEVDRLRLLRASLRELRSGNLTGLLLKAAAMARLRYQSAKFDLTPRRLWVPLREVPIDRPIFLLGVQGGGATILARTLYRHPSAVYASGNSTYWAGLDEIHNCLHIHGLPEALVHRSLHFGNLNDTVEDHPLFGHQRSWLYATDELLPRYRRTAVDADAATTAQFRRVLGKVIRAYAHDPHRARFVDMSQLYTIQVPFIQEMLRDCGPKFILVARNPYATCARAAEKEYTPHFGSRIQSDRALRVRCAVEHWSNSYRLALEAARSVPMQIVRYEDFVREPEQVIRRLCGFCELEFHPDQVPGPGQRVPLGSVAPEKWYPLKVDENEKYLKNVPRDLAQGLRTRAADVVQELGYEVLDA